MILTKDTPEAILYTVHDCAGTLIPYVTYFDSETCEIEAAVSIPTEEGWTLLKQEHEGKQTPIFLRYEIPGAKLEKHTPEEVAEKRKEAEEVLENMKKKIEDKLKPED